MTDSTNPRVMADNIRELSGISGSQGDAIKALGFYSTTEVDTGMKYGDFTIYRKIIYVENLPNNTTIGVAHEIATLKDVLKLELIAQAVPGNVGRNINISYNYSNIYISTTTDLSANPGIIVFEYTKSTSAALNSPAPDDTRSIEPEEIREEIPEEIPEENVK